MSLRIRLSGALGLAAVAAACAAGCGKAAPEAGKAPAPGQAELRAFIPCGMELPFLAARNAFQAERPGVKVDVVLDNANILIARVVEKGEKPDVIVSPGTVEMDALVKAGRVAAEDVRHFGVYELVLFGPRDNPGKVESFEDLLRPEVVSIALADPAHNSVGLYTRQALQKLGLWDKVQAKLLLTDHPITAYGYVAQGKVQASFAYRSCPLQSAPRKLEYSKVRIIKSVPRELYGPAYATVGILKTARDRGLAESFVEFLQSDKGQALLAENGVPNLVRLRVFVPCGLTAAMYKVKGLFEAEHPSVTLDAVFDRIDALTQQVLESKARPDVHVSIGEVETDLLVQAGHVKREDALPLGRFRLALCTHVSKRDVVTGLQDLAKPEVKRILLTDPARSSVGLCARTALESAGLWEKLQDKIVYMPTIKDAHGELAAGKADAGFAYLGCPIPLDPKKAEYSKVVCVQVLDEKSYRGAVAAASVLAETKHRTEALEFARFMTQPKAQALLKELGLSPLASAQEGAKKDERVETK